MPLPRAAGGAPGYGGLAVSGVDWGRRARIAGILTWVGYAVLLAQQVADALVYSAPWIIWIGKLLPLLIFLPGMLRDNLRSFIWLCFVCLGYFISLVERLFADPDGVLGMVGMVAVVLLFCSAMLYVRWRARALKQAAESSG